MILDVDSLSSIADPREQSESIPKSILIRGRISQPFRARFRGGEITRMGNSMVAVSISHKIGEWVRTATHIAAEMEVDGQQMRKPTIRIGRDTQTAVIEVGERFVKPRIT
jgi:hypothetical protein